MVMLNCPLFVFDFRCRNDQPTGTSDKAVTTTTARTNDVATHQDVTNVTTPAAAVTTPAAARAKRVMTKGHTLALNTLTWRSGSPSSRRNFNVNET